MPSKRFKVTGPNRALEAFGVTGLPPISSGIIRAKKGAKSRLNQELTPLLKARSEERSKLLREGMPHYTERIKNLEREINAMRKRLGWKPIYYAK